VRKLTRALIIVKTKNRLQRQIESKVGLKKFGKQLVKAKRKKVEKMRNKTMSTGKKQHSTS